MKDARPRTRVRRRRRGSSSPPAAGRSAPATVPISTTPAAARRSIRASATATRIGLIHGGMLSAFLDGVLAGAAGAAPASMGVTVHLSIDFLDMGRAGEWVIGEASLTRAASDLAFVEGRAHVGGRSARQGHRCLQADAPPRALDEARASHCGAGTLMAKGAPHRWPRGVAQPGSASALGAEGRGSNHAAPTIGKGTPGGTTDRVSPPDRLRPRTTRRRRGALADRLPLWLTPSVGATAQVLGPTGRAAADRRGAESALRSVLGWALAPAERRRTEPTWHLLIGGRVALVLVFAVAYPLATGGLFGGGTDRADALDVTGAAMLAGQPVYDIADLSRKSRRRRCRARCSWRCRFHLIGSAAYAERALVHPVRPPRAAHRRRSPRRGGLPGDLRAAAAPACCWTSPPAAISRPTPPTSRFRCSR